MEVSDLYDEFGNYIGPEFDSSEEDDNDSDFTVSPDIQFDPTIKQTMKEICLIKILEFLKDFFNFVDNEKIKTNNNKLTSESIKALYKQYKEQQGETTD